MPRVVAVWKASLSNRSACSVTSIPSGEALESEWDEYSAQKELRLLKPTLLKDTKIDFKEADEELVYQLHCMGLGCSECPLRDERRDFENCKWAVKPSWLRTARF